MRNRLFGAIGLGAVALLLGSCSGDLPQNTFDPAGPVAQKQADLIIPVLWVAAGVFVLVEGGIVLIALKYRHRKGEERTPPQTHGNTRLEIGWTIAPALILAFVMVPTVGLIWELSERPADAMHVTVKGYQWWWGFEYTDPEMTVGYGSSGPIVTADTLVVPVGQTVDLSLEAVGGGARDAEGEADHAVIHSFWTPRLFGKQDVVPGHEGNIVFSADEPGTYWGQCAEFCGLQHGRMWFRVVVLDEAAWAAWVANEKTPGAEPSSALARQGMDLFLNGEFDGGQCIACHAVGGTEAGGIAAPDLTHFAAPTHECFAGCNWDTFVNGEPNLDDLKAWLRDPGAVKLGAKMPDYGLSEDEIDAIAAYLYSLT
ncbi:MAG: cytochrome c oxidase subunit II [Actinomycetota bacterium]